MSKYDFELDLTHENSLSKIVSRIKPASTILEFGPAEGRLTRHLSENMNCQVTVIEIDPEAYRKARQYAADGICADAEDNLWVEYLHGKQYEYVIFADVLEHLKKPERVLKNVLQFLAEGGSILTSIPNIAHNKILIKLYENRFDYTDVGLLDDTHIRFWGYENLEPFFNEIGYKIIYEDIISDLGWEGDQAVELNQINGQLLSSLNRRYLGSAYQFVLELKETHYCEENEIVKKRGEELKKAGCQIIHAFYDYGDGFQGESCRELLASPYGENGMYIAEIPIDRGAIQARFDPVEGEKIYCRILMATDEFGNSCEVHPANAYSYEGLDVFDNTDPQYIINIGYENAKMVTIAYSLSFVGNQEIAQFRKLLSMNAEIGRIQEENCAVQSQNEALRRVRREHEEIISELNDNLLSTRQSYDKVISELNHNFLNEKQNYEKTISELGAQLDLARRAEDFRDRIILDLNIKAEKVNGDILLQKKECEDIQKRNKTLQEEMEQYRQKFEEISHSSIWRLSEPLRDCMDKIRKMNEEKIQDNEINLPVSEETGNQEYPKIHPQEEEKYAVDNEHCSEDDIKNRIAPLLSAFIRLVAKKTDDKLIFLSERGRFLQKIYQEYCQNTGIAEIPNTVADITQESMSFSLIEEVADVRAFLQVSYEGLLSGLLQKRFEIAEPMLSEDEVVRLPDDEEKVLAAIGVNAEVFLDKISGNKRELKEYLEECLSPGVETSSIKASVVDLTDAEWFSCGVKKLLGKEIEDCSLSEFYKEYTGIEAEMNFKKIQKELEIIVTGCDEDSLRERKMIEQFILAQGEEHI